MLSIIVSTPSGRIKAERLYMFFLFFYLFFFFCTHDNSWKPQPIRTEFSHDFYLENLGQVRKWASQVTCNPPNRGSSTPSKLTYIWFQPIQTKFSHMIFDWNSSSEFENGHHRLNVTPPNRGCLPPKKMFVDMITLERLNQSESNFHIWVLTGIARPSSKIGVAGHM